MRALVAASILSVVGGGCVSSAPHAAPGVAVECVVEKFEADASVIYHFDFCAQFAETSLSHVRVLSPTNLRDRVYAIDLGPASDRKKGDYASFATVGAKLRFWIPENLVDSKPESLIPVSLLKEGPNQTPEPTTTLVTPRAGARVAPSVVVAHL